MQIETEAHLLSSEATPYDVGGNKGVSYRIRLNVGGEIFVCKSNAGQVQTMKDFVGQEGNAVLIVKSRKEVMSLELVSFGV